MISTSDSREACVLLWERKQGVFYTKDDAMIYGGLLNIEDEIDSPDGIASITLVTAPGIAVEIGEDEFERATFED